MVFLSPQSFIFSVFYFFMLLIMFCTRNFFVFWTIIELRTLVFIGVAYSLFKNNFSPLLLFFIIQSLSAFSLILFYFIDFSVGFSVALLLKLSIFPFYFWYLNLIPLFNNSIFFLSSTIFKLPSIFIISNFYCFINFSVLFMSALLTITIGALVIINSNDLRFVLIASSVVNNSWFVFTQYANMLLFIAYFVIYRLLLFYVLYIVNTQSTYRFVNIENSYSNTQVVLCLFTMAGLPPFPLFFIKMSLVHFISSYSNSSFYVFVLILIRVATILGYLKHVFRNLLNSNNLPLILLF